MKGAKREKGMEERKEKCVNCGYHLPPHEECFLGFLWGLIEDKETWAGVSGLGCASDRGKTQCALWSSSVLSTLALAILCSLPILPWGSRRHSLGQSRKLVRKQDPPSAHWIPNSVPDGVM